MQTLQLGILQIKNLLDGLFDEQFQIVQKMHSKLPIKIKILNTN